MIENRFAVCYKGPSNLTIQPIPLRQFQASNGADGARHYYLHSLALEATAGVAEVVPFPLALQHKVVRWRSERDARLTFRFPVEKACRATLHLIAVHRPDGTRVRVLLDGKALQEVRLQAEHNPRVLNVDLPAVDLTAATHVLALQCLEPGVVELDTLWIQDAR